MLPARASHRYALLLLLAWSALFIGHLLGRADNAASAVSSEEPTAPPGSRASATVTSWQAYLIRPGKSFEQGRLGTVRIGRNADGLVICGVVDGSTPLWPSEKGSLEYSDHVAVWLANGTPPALPPIGWGNQFEFIYPTSATDGMDYQRHAPEIAARLLAKQKSWYDRQLPYREKVVQLFQRRWRLVPGRSEEFIATQAFASLTAPEQKNLAALAVRGSPVTTFSGSSSATNEFEILIPWEAFPPMRSLSVQDLRLMVEVVSYASVNVERSRSRMAQNGDLFPYHELIPIRLSAAREYTLTACRFDLHDAMLGGGGNMPYTPSEEATRYIRPGRTTDLDTVVVMENTSAGYQYEPDPDSRSPIALEARFWTRPLEQGGLLGGPRLTWFRNGTTIRSDFSITDPVALTLRSDPNGDVVIKHGPLVWWSRFGSGQCGACPRIGVDFYRLRLADQTILNPLSYDDVVGDDGDITVSADWRIVSGYRKDWDTATNGFLWQQTDYLQSADGINYVKKTAHQASPPEPRTLTPSSQ